MNYHKISMFGAALSMLAVGFSDTALGQTITTNPPLASGMSFQVQSGGAQGQQNLSINTPNPTTVFVAVPAGQTWLKVNNAPGGSNIPYNTPASLPVEVNTTGLSNGQLVSADITIVIANVPASQVSFQVSMTVGTPSLLTANPANITFSAVQGNSFGSPNSVPVTVSSSGQALSYNATPSTTSGGNWLLLTNTSSIPTNSNSAGFSVSVNAQNLAAGTYQGVITLQSTTTGDSTTIPVTLSVTTGSLLNVTPSTLNNFVFQAGSLQGSFQPQTQNLMVSTSGGALNYQVTVTQPSGTLLTQNWLVVSPTGGLATATPETISLSLSYQGVAGLQVGTYTLDVNIAPTAGGGSTKTTPVTLVVSNNGLLTVDNSNLTFTLPFGSTTTSTQQVHVTSSNSTSVPYNAQSSQSWLFVSPGTGNTASNSVLAITVNDTGLAASSTPYTGTITLSPQNGDQYTVVINVQLTVSSATSTIYAAPDQLVFSYEQSQSVPGQQVVQLTGAANVSFSVTTSQMTGSNCPTTTWLTTQASASVTPATITVGVLTTGMTSGFCNGTVIVTYNNGSSSNSTVNIGVTVDIAPSTPLLTVTPDSGFGVVTATVNTSSVLSSRIFIGSTHASSLGYTAFASTPNSPVTWLSLGNSQGGGQEYLQVFIVPSGLQVGVYTGSITINANNSATLPSGAVTIPVVLIVSSSTTVAVSPVKLTFTEAQGSTTALPSQTITLTATGGSTGFSVSVQSVTGGSWLQVSPTSGTATGTITATVPANTLSQGTYTSNILVRFTNSATPTVTIPVSLTVGATQTVTVSPTPLTFSYQLGSAAPANQTLSVTSVGGSVAVTISASSTPAWLAVSPASGSTPVSATVSIVPSVLTTAQTYNGSITVTPAGQSPITVPVTLTVTGVPPPQPSSISNSASGAFGAISPGELITIKGVNLGPTTATSFTVAAGNTVSSTLAGVQVLFDTIPGTPLYVSPTQINVIVPYEISGRASTNVVVSYSGQLSTGILQSVANQAPGIFTDNSTGVGQASVLNLNGSLNGPASGVTVGTQTIPTTPTTAGSVIAVFMTGGVRPTRQA